MDENFNLYRDILLYISENSSGKGLIKKLNKKEYSTTDIKEHATLLYEYEYFESTAKPYGTKFVDNIYRLTKNGQNIVQLIKDQDKWDKANTEIENKVGSTPFEILILLLKKNTMDELGIN